MKEVPIAALPFADCSAAITPLRQRFILVVDPDLSRSVCDHARGFHPLLEVDEPFQTEQEQADPDSLESGNVRGLRWMRNPCS